MNLTISGHHLEVTPALRSYVTSKLDRISRHFDQVVDDRLLGLALGKIQIDFFGNHLTGPVMFNDCMP